MRIRWKGFELPTKVILTEEKPEEHYGKFTIEPFERGYGITIGNSLRRVLISSLEGTAPVSAKIEGALHEFSSLEGVREDVINICLNLKGLVIKTELEGPQTVTINKTGRGAVTGADVDCPARVEVANPDMHIAWIEGEDTTFRATIEVRKGRGYVRSEDFTWSVDDSLGAIPLDAGFSPVRRARWRVEETRVGKMTNYDRLILEIWTNGTLTPEDALVESAVILRKHLNPFVQYHDLGSELEKEAPGQEEPMEETSSASSSRSIDSDLVDKISQPVSVLDPSVRAANCLAAEGIKTIADLVRHEEHEMLQVRNFGKTSLKEIKIKLADQGLSFGMKMDEVEA
jgi:DNA-directed RNA polymerase subunit alpha